MSQIVLCQPVYPSRLDHQNLFQPSVDPTINPSNAIYSKKSFSNKPSGAFKLFKLKKNKKQDQRNPNPQPIYPEHSPQPKKVFKLKKRSVQDGTPRTNYIFSETAEPPFGYFDPNIAPLHHINENQSEEDKSYCLGSIDKIALLPIHNQQRIIVQKKHQQNIQIPEEQPDYSLQFQYQEQEPIKGDPFIIIKKVEIKHAKLKKSLGLTPKLLKKQKESLNIEGKINSITQLNDLKFKQKEIPSPRSKEEQVLQETEKTAHLNDEYKIPEVKIKERRNTKRTQCSLGDISECHSQFSAEEEHLFKNLFGSPSKKVKGLDQ